MDCIFVKNSSSDINYGTYKPQIIIRTDGGRLYFDKKYITRFECNETLNILKIIIEEEKGKEDV